MIAKVFIIILSALIGALQFVLGNIGAGVIFGGVCLFFLSIPFLWDWHAGRLWRESSLRDETLLVSFSGEGLHFRSSKHESRLQWSLFTKVVQFKDGFLLFESTSSFYWLPVTAFGSLSDVTEFQAIMIAKIADTMVMEPIAALKDSTTD